MEIPSYNQLAEIITESFNKFENHILAILDKELSPEDRIRLDELLFILPTSTKAPITELKNINQALGAKKIK